jgi:hypothetical protein
MASIRTAIWGGILGVISSLPIPTYAAVTIWEQQLLTRDRLPMNQGRSTELMFFDRSRGEFSVNIENGSRKIVSFSGVFRGFRPRVYRALRHRIQSLRTKPDIQVLRMSRTFDPRTGKPDWVMRLDLSALRKDLSDEEFGSLMASNRVQFKLNVRKTRTHPFDLSLSLEFFNRDGAREMKLLEWRPDTAQASKGNSRGTSATGDSAY